MEMPEYVFNNIDAFGNCALPYSYNKYSVEELEKFFIEKTRRKCVITKATFYKTIKAEKEHRGKDYYIVWKESSLKKRSKRLKFGGKIV